MDRKKTVFGDVLTEPGVDELLNDFQNEIRRYELGSFGSSDYFLSSGRTMALSLRTGSFRLFDALHILEMTGAMASQACFTNHVGTR